MPVGEMGTWRLLLYEKQLPANAQLSCGSAALPQQPPLCLRVPPRRQRVKVQRSLLQPKMKVILDREKVVPLLCLKSSDDSHTFSCSWLQSPQTGVCWWDCARLQRTMVALTSSLSAIVPVSPPPHPSLRRTDRASRLPTGRLRCSLWPATFRAAVTCVVCV